VYSGSDGAADGAWLGKSDGRNVLTGDVTGAEVGAATGVVVATTGVVVATTGVLTGTDVDTGTATGAGVATDMATGVATAAGTEVGADLGILIIITGDRVVTGASAATGAVGEAAETVPAEIMFVVGACVLTTGAEETGETGTGAVTGGEEVGIAGEKPGEPARELPLPGLPFGDGWLGPLGGFVSFMSPLAGIYKNKFV
jgi:hypothetical protein